MDVSFRKSAALRWDGASNSFSVVSMDQLAWSVSDAGTMFGAILVERLRTYAGKLVDIEDHSDRLFSAAIQLGIDIAVWKDRFANVCGQLIEHNHDLVRRLGDVSVVVLVSPGELDDARGFGKHPTCMAHISPLPFKRLAKWYQFGTQLLSSAYTTVPSSCWPTQMKSRSRVPYLLSELNLKDEQGTSLALLKTTCGTIADTSIANVVVVMQDDTIVSPSSDKVLIGCTLKSITRLANTCGMSFEYRDIHDQDLAEAKEVILTGTNGGVWFARSVDDQLIGSGLAGPICSKLTYLWKEHVGIDFVEQACNFELIAE